jgi:NAD-dependent DNA ligase
MTLNNLTDIDDIVTLLKQCDDAYFNVSESPLSDREYDTLKRRAFLMEPSNDYFIKVGSDVRGGKIKLPYNMGSLNQIYEGEVEAWVAKYNLYDEDIIITDKLDGVSCMLVYNNDKFSIAYSRGNGIEGADISRHVKYIQDVPVDVNADYLTVRAEIIMQNDVFNEYYSDKYANPRNFVAGAMNRKETDDSVLKHLNVIAYEIVAGTIDGNSDYNLNTKLTTLTKLNNLGFSTVKHRIVKGKDLNDKMLAQMLSEARAASPYELDGLVLTVNDHASMVRLSKSSSINPEHSIKYKIIDNDSVVETFVKNVEWNISKSGYFKPRIEILPVELYGTTVTWCTGFNAKTIIDNGIGVGAKIKLTKSGSVIPYWMTTVSKSSTPSFPPTTYGEWELNETGVEAVLKNKNHPAIIAEQVLDFFETFKVDLLKEASLSKVLSYVGTEYNGKVKLFDEIIYDICDLIEMEWTQVLGVNGSKVYASLKNRLENAKPETFFGALPYMGVGFGVRKAKVLLVGVTNVDDLEHISLDEIVAKEGFDVKTATNILNGLPSAFQLMETLENMGILNFVYEQKTTELANLNVVMTGFRDAELQATIESMGGKVSSGVSKKTTHLLCMDTDSNSGKMQKAKEFGVQIMTPDDFKLQMNL